MQILTEETLNDAVNDLVSRIRTGQQYELLLINSVASDHDMRPAALKSHFEQRFPGGYVGAALPTAKEHASEAARAEAKRLLADFGQYSNVDGREILLNGTLHTLIAENRSKQHVFAFDHGEMVLCRFSFSDYEAMRKEKP